MTAVEASLADVYSAALRGDPCQIRSMGSPDQPLPVQAWTTKARPSDVAVLRHCVGPTLDIGCGPGRMTEYLAGQGRLVLGVDLVEEAVLRTRARGAPAIRRDVFSPIPGEGRWGSALLADGNLGIGGNPVALLRRTAELIAPTGRVVADLAPPGVATRRRVLWLTTRSTRSSPFRWAEVGVDGISALAAASGYARPSIYQFGSRWFAVLCREQ